jgi:hypothetical protein
MSGRSLFSAAAAAEARQQADARALGSIETPRRAVSIFERELGAGGRAEFVTNGEPDGVYWPAMHTWPDYIAEDMLKVARRWLLARPNCRLLATSCMVDHSARPPVLVFMLHYETTGSAQADAAPAAANSTGDGASPPPGVSPPPPACCAECG